MGDPNRHFTPQKFLVSSAIFVETWSDCFGLSKLKSLYVLKFHAGSRGIPTTVIIVRTDGLGR